MVRALPSPTPGIRRSSEAHAPERFEQALADSRPDAGRHDECERVIVHVDG